MRKKEITIKEKPIIAKYFIATLSKKKKEYKRIMINGEETYYEMNKDGDLREYDTKETIYPHMIDRQNGYYLYELFSSNDEPMIISRHRLLAALFIPIPRYYLNAGLNQENLVVNHKDGIKGHDEIENLEWLTVRENTLHAIENGLIDYCGEKSYRATISNSTAIRICELLAEGKRPKEVAEITGISEKIIRHIYYREAWKQISEKYIFPEYEGSKPYSHDDELIRKACELIQEGKMTNKQIGDIVGLDQRYINDIKNNKRRTDISKDYDFSKVPKRNPPKAIKAKHACELLQEGKLSVAEIAEITGIQSSVVSGIKCGRYWTDVSKDYTFGEIPYKKYNDPDKVERVKKACELLQEGNLTHKEIVKETGLTIDIVQSISAGKSWKFISENYNFPDKRYPAEIDENLHKVCQMFEKGFSDNKISKETGITRDFLRKFRKRETRTDISKDYNF